MSIFHDPRLKPLFSRETIAQRVLELGREIEAHYRDASDGLVLLGVLKGSIIFLADLVRAIDLPLEIELIGVSSYGEATESSGVVRITQDLVRPIKNKNVLVVEDIFETGLTLKYLIDNLSVREPKSIELCTLLKKDTVRRADINPTFIGFDIPDAFVVGYGLDLAERFRNLPEIAIYQT